MVTRAVSLCAVALALSGCGAGSGLFTLLPLANVVLPLEQSAPAAAALAVSWQSGEYFNSTGLNDINAAQGYAGIAGTAGQFGGEGVTVAIIDQGVDPTHPELNRALQRGQGVFVIEDNAATAASVHGSHVGGIVAANRAGTPLSGSDMHGVAYLAGLTSLQPTRPSLFGGNPDLANFAANDIALAIYSAAGILKGVRLDTGQLVDPQATLRTIPRRALQTRFIQGLGTVLLSSPEAESDIMNLSLGGPSPMTTVQQAMRDAAGNGKIMVIAAGNEAAPEPSYPARHAIDGGVSGLAVVAVNAVVPGVLAPSSSLCGVTAAVCIQAPGTSINSTVPGGGFGTLSGTSMAAPMVAGALAVLQSAFPGVSPAALVNRLLTTAAPTGLAPAVGGVGFLNLQAGLVPFGGLSIPLANSTTGAAAPVAQTTATFGAAFGDIGGALAAVGPAMALDELGFPFRVDLADHVAATLPTAGIEQYVTGGTLDSIVAPLGPHASVLVAPGFDTTAPAGSAPASGADTAPQAAARLAFGVTDAISGTLVINGGQPLGFGALPAVAGDPVASLSLTAMLSPYGEIAGIGNGGAVAWRLSPTTSVQLGAFQDNDPEAATALQQLELRRRLGERLEVTLGYGRLSEGDGFLGSTASGAMASDPDSATDFFTIAATSRVSDRVTLVGSYTEGSSTVSTGGGLLGAGSRVTANAFAAGVTIDDVLAKRGRLSIFVGQPLRVRAAEFDVSLPTSRTPDGQVNFTTETVDLAPADREVVFLIGYRLGLSAQVDVAPVASVRLSPGHEASNDTEIGIGGKIQIRF